MTGLDLIPLLLLKREQKQQQQQQQQQQPKQPKQQQLEHLLSASLKRLLKDLASVEAVVLAGDATLLIVATLVFACLVRVLG
mmetsp:Transcript_39911/g.78583  ORF Transcript_39911/g.78583 Transcript_39911/m.78583 type:complete len:82 (+) Transcript_39911:738-983(+)